MLLRVVPHDRPEVVIVHESHRVGAHGGETRRPALHDRTDPRARAASPPVFASASSIWRTDTVIPGRLSARGPTQRSAGTSCAWIRFAMASAGDISHIAVSGSTGHAASMPASGSRMMPLAKLDAAAFGLPGRTTIVGSRTARPSIIPLRE
jgi:hypothetical protein